MSDLTLSDDQKDTINKIRDWSSTLGLDPNFALSIAYPESAARHVAADDPKSTAFGPFQVNRATAKANDIDYDEMVKNKDLAVWAGLKNLQRHALNPELQGDPSRIIAAHRYGENSPYAKTGSPEDITPGLADFFTKVGSVYGEDLPKSVYAPPAEYGHESAHANAATVAASETPIDRTMAERLAGGVAGVGAGAVLAGKAAIPMAKVRAALAARRAIGNYLNPQQPNPPAPATAPVTPADVAAPAKTPGMERWFAGQTGTARAVPSNVSANVASTREAPGVLAENALGFERIAGAGIPLTSIHTNPGGQIGVVESPQAQRARIQMESALPLAAGEPNPFLPPGQQPSSPWAERARAVMTHPAIRGASMGFGIGTQTPEILEGIRNNSSYDVAKAVGLGAAYGLAPTLLPTVMQKGLAKILPPLAAAAGGYDAYGRATKGDYLGSLISSAGGLGALAPLVVKGPKGWALAAASGIGSPLANYLRDRYGSGVSPESNPAAANIPTRASGGLVHL